METLCHSISSCIQNASIMPFNIRLHTVLKHYAIQYHAAYTVHKHFAIQYHAVYGTQSLCRPISCCMQLVRNHNAIQYHVAYGMQSLCHSISCCIQYARIICSISCCIQYTNMPFNIKLHTVCKHYAIQCHAAYSTQALCFSISC